MSKDLVFGSMPDKVFKGTGQDRELVATYEQPAVKIGKNFATVKSVVSKLMAPAKINAGTAAVSLSETTLSDLRQAAVDLIADAQAFVTNEGLRVKPAPQRKGKAQQVSKVTAYKDRESLRAAAAAARAEAA